MQIGPKIGLQIGESVVGKVIECQEGGELLISLSGRLIRVANETKRRFAVGDPVTLVVRGIDRAGRPLRFQLIEERAEQRRRGHLNVNI